MADKTYVLLEERGLIRLEGEDVRTFLQGLVSNDVDRVAPGAAVHAAFLTPQGKYLHDFMVVQVSDALFLDCEKERLADLHRRLKMYRLRAKVDLADVSEDFTVAALFGGVPDIDGAYPDPRHPDLGARAILPREGAAEAMEGQGYAAMSHDTWDEARIRLGVPDGSRDMVLEKALLLENGFDELAGVDFDKGCYMGQELTARTKHRALIKKRLVPLEIDGPAPEFGTSVMLGEAEAGEMRSSCGGVGLALMRLEHMEDAEAVFSAGGASLKVRKPGWAGF